LFNLNIGDKIMLLVKRNNQPTIENLFNQFFNYDFTDQLDSSRIFNPKTNIFEDEKSYKVEILVSGFKKEDFKIDVEKDILKVSAQKEQSKENKNADKLIFREFSIQNFERMFTISKDVKVEEIEATYDTGILTIRLPKSEESVVKKLIPIK